MLENRHTVRAERIRSRIFDLVMGEEPGVGAARDVLESASGRTWDHIERQIFAMLPKIKGESRVTLVELLLAKGAEATATSLLGSRSAVRRCRGAHCPTAATVG